MSVRRIACIDIGTNSIRMLGLEINRDRFTPLIRLMEITRLGKGVDVNGVLNRQSIERAKHTLRDFKEKGEDLGITAFYVAATSAVRDAANKKEFLHEIKDSTGLTVEVLSGEEEAKLSFIGAVFEEPLEEHEPVMVIDIGGGSTEFILGKGKEPAVLKSFDVGAVRMTEKYITADPIAVKEYNAMLEGVKRIIGPFIKEIRQTDPIDQVIGVGGTVTTLAAMLLKMEIYDIEKIQGFTFGLQQLRGLIGEMLAKKMDERKKIPGLQPKRADIIPAGAGILLCIMEEMEIDEIKVKDSDLLLGMAITREGLMKKSTV